MSSAGEGRIMLLWQEREVSEQITTYVQILDDRLREVGPRAEIGRSTAGGSDRMGMSAAYDGENALVAWTDRGPGDVDRIVTRVLGADGSARDDGEPRVVEPSPGAQYRPSVTALTSRSGFAVAWEAMGDPQDEDQNGRGIRMIVLDERGRPLFANPACDAADFQVNRELEDDQSRPALTTLAGGTVLVAWTGRDISDTGVRSTAFRPQDLLPIERGTTSP